MRTDLFDYELPANLIAQHPRPRGSSRLLTLDRIPARSRTGASRSCRTCPAGDLIVGTTSGVRRPALRRDERRLVELSLRRRPKRRRGRSAKPGPSGEAGTLEDRRRPVGGDPRVERERRRIVLSTKPSRTRFSSGSATSRSPYRRPPAYRRPEDARYQPIRARTPRGRRATRDFTYAGSALSRKRVEIATHLRSAPETFKPVTAEERAPRLEEKESRPRNDRFDTSGRERTAESSPDGRRQTERWKRGRGNGTKARLSTDVFIVYLGFGLGRRRAAHQLPLPAVDDLLGCALADRRTFSPHRRAVSRGTCSTLRRRACSSPDRESPQGGGVRRRRPAAPPRGAADLEPRRAHSRTPPRELVANRTPVVSGSHRFRTPR